MLKVSELKKIFPKRSPESHKGQNGRVLVIGGSIEYYGAPIFSAIGALHSGVDLVYLAVPECNFEVTRNYCPDFIVRKYQGEYLNSKAFDLISSLAVQCDVIVIGPGLGDRKETLETVKKIITEVSKPMIIDADAIQVLQSMEKFPLKQKIVVTPHHQEFESLTGKPFKKSENIEQKNMLLRALATDIKINILLKGKEDIIASENGEIANNQTGNAGMTVGGTGDILAGAVAGLMAQGVEPFDACQLGAFTLGKTGDKLLKEKGYGFSASDLAAEFPYILRELSDF